jgi:predicted AlkP superfamily phosphohydrolase/phosphomutase
LNKHKVLVIGLDGYEQSFGNAMMQAGELPALKNLKDRSAVWLLDHGWATRTGLAWEHFSTGLKPEAARRWSAINFNPQDYSVWQEGTTLSPFVKNLDCKTVVFDPPYFDLGAVKNTFGVVNWGAHDPGISTTSRPARLHTELTESFGPYPAKDWIYGITWQSAERTRLMGAALTCAVNVRAEMALWLLQERFPDWDLGIVVVGEIHSATETFWHGIDPDHPLHNLPSAHPSGGQLREVYRATDRLIDKLVRTFPEVTVVAFSMGGMGPNNSDVPSMVLLPELFHRKSFGESLMQTDPAWSCNNEGMPVIRDDEQWSKAVNARYPQTGQKRGRKKKSGGQQRAIKKFSEFLRAGMSRIELPKTEKPLKMSVNWMPVMKYSPFWPKMEAFVLPSFYDGRIRVNLAGRERQGIVPPGRYTQFLDELRQFLSQCRDMEGKQAIDDFEYQASSSPLELHPTAADLVVVWRDSTLAIEHPQCGRIGPVPYRRTGGHTGPYGVAYIANAGIESGDYGIRSAFDVVPTIIQLLGKSSPGNLSGQSLLRKV